MFVGVEDNMSTVSHSQAQSAPSDLRADEMRILDVLRETENGRMKIAAVAAASGLSLAETQAAAAKLIRHDLVRRVDGNRDVLELDHKGLQRFLQRLR
jgi:DNA-binding IclR family transcriptional regulator